MTILLVEDEMRIAHFMKKGLEMERYAVDTACDGEAALKLATTNVYDLVILDVLLPKMTGLEVSRKLRENGIRTPIIMLTARDTLEDREKGFAAGADDYMIKPFLLEDLIARIYALIGKKGI